MGLREEAVARLQQRGETLSCAESCTGGLLTSQIATLPGVSSVLMGSVVAYSNDVKHQLLGVPESLLKAIGAVSLPVAKAMAHGVRERLATDWSISITGIAGPGGGTEQKPVGTVCIAVVGPGVEEVEQMLFTGNRVEIQMASAEHALKMLNRFL